MTKIALIFACGFLLAACSSNDEKPTVTNFSECIAAGNPAMESFPRQCVHEGETFTEEV